MTDGRGKRRGKGDRGSGAAGSGAGKGQPASGDALAQAKSRVSRGMLGAGGVHAVGLRREDETVVVYVDAAGADALATAAAKARELAAPFKAVAVASAAARSKETPGGEA